MAADGAARTWRVARASGPGVDQYFAGIPNNSYQGDDAFWLERRDPTTTLISLHDVYGAAVAPNPADGSHAGAPIDGTGTAWDYKPGGDPRLVTRATRAWCPTATWTATQWSLTSIPGGVTAGAPDAVLR